MIINPDGVKVRCEGITVAGVQCKCWALQRINAIPYCLQHARKELCKAEPHKMRFSETKNPKKFDRDKIRWVKG